MNRETQFKAVMESNKDRIYRICCCYVRDEERRKDVFQEALINIWEGLGSFKGNSQISTWIYRIAVNTCLGYSRSEKRRRKVFDETKEVDFETVSDQTGGGDPAQMEEDVRRLYDCINMLQPIEKTLVSLYLEDVSTTEMSEILGITEGNVRVKLHRIKKALKERLEGSSHGS
jgi:RNA polymerase sigma-70 factor (ECF subfamily)